MFMKNNVFNLNKSLINWSLTNEYSLVGNIQNSYKFEENNKIRTSEILNFELRENIIIFSTKSGVYNCKLENINKDNFEITLNNLNEFTAKKVFNLSKQIKNIQKDFQNVQESFDQLEMRTI